MFWIHDEIYLIALSAIAKQCLHSPGLLCSSQPQWWGGWGGTARTADPAAQRDSPYWASMASQQGKLVGKQGYHCSGTGKALGNRWWGICFGFLWDWLLLNCLNLSPLFFSHSPSQFSPRIPSKRDQGSTCVVFNYITVKSQQVNYGFPFLPSMYVVLTLFTVQGWFFCFSLSILLITPSVLFTFPRAFLTEQVTGEALIAFLGSGVLTCFLSAKTFAGMGGKEKKPNISNPKVCLSKSTCWKTSCHGNHCSPSRTQTTLMTKAQLSSVLYQLMSLKELTG